MSHDKTQSKKQRIPSIIFEKQWRGTEDWDDIDQPDQIERVRRQPREQTRQSQKQLERRQRQKACARIYKNVQKNRKHEGNGKP